jgi:hypothetical protein
MLYRIHYSVISASVRNTVNRETGIVNGMSALVNELLHVHIQGVPGGKVNILGGYSIGHSKQKTLYEYVSYFERFPR